MTREILTLDEICKDDTRTAGFDGVEMALLHAAGIPVAHGFVVTTEAYSQQVSALGLEERLADAWESGGRLDELAEEAATAILEGGVDEHLRSKIVETARELGAPLIDAKLSPAVASRDAAAIAGLGWSAAFLPFEAAADAVAECWASLWGARQLKFRKGAGIGPGPAAPWGAAVLISAAEPAPMRGIVVPAEQDAGESDAWVIRVEPRLPSEQEIAIQKSKAEKTGSPLTSAQAEALTILADGAAEALGEPRALRWGFDGRRFTIAGTLDVR
jgi:phosphoenolpyruvate synthase/pyruvate phosphate dikinase